MIRIFALSPRGFRLLAAVAVLFWGTCSAANAREMQWQKVGLGTLPDGFHSGLWRDHSPIGFNGLVTGQIDLSGSGTWPVAAIYDTSTAEITILSESRWSSVYGRSDTGFATGSAGLNGFGEPFLYSHDTGEILAIDVSQGAGTAVNDLGQVAVSSSWVGASDGIITIWPDGNTLVPSGNLESFHVTTLRNDGLVGGIATDRFGGRRAFLWPSNRPDNLRVLNDTELISRWTSVLDISPSGMAVGTISQPPTAGSDTDLLLWDGDTWERYDIPGFPLASIDLVSINRSHAVVVETGWVFDGGSWSELPGIEFSNLVQVHRINDDWQVLGLEEGAGGVHLVRWDPVYTNGDYDANGIIDQVDLDLALMNWGNRLTSPREVGWYVYPPGPEVVSQTHLDKVLVGWGRQTQMPVLPGAATGAVPEPASWLLLVILGHKLYLIHPGFRRSSPIGETPAKP